MSLYHLARAYDLMNRRGEAAESWRAFLKATPKLAASAPELLAAGTGQLSVLESDAPGAAGVQAEDKDSGVFALDERLRQCARKGTASPVLLQKSRRGFPPPEPVTGFCSTGRWAATLRPWETTNQALLTWKPGGTKPIKTVLKQIRRRCCLIWQNLLPEQAVLREPGNPV